jgi:hypothetical protein
MCLFIIVCRGRNGYLFLARGWFVLFSACWEWEDLLQFGILGSIPHSLLLNLVIMAYILLLRISAMLECIPDSGLTQHTVTNCFLHLNSDKAFAGFQHVCSINVTDVLQIFITSYFSWRLLHNIVFVWGKLLQSALVYSDSASLRSWSAHYCPQSVWNKHYMKPGYWKIWPIRMCILVWVCYLRTLVWYPYTAQYTTFLNSVLLTFLDSVLPKQSQLSFHLFIFSNPSLLDSSFPLTRII